MTYLPTYDNVIKAFNNIFEAFKNMLIVVLESYPATGGRLSSLVVYTLPLRCEGGQCLLLLPTQPANLFYSRSPRYRLKATIPG